jgi:triphosphatase
MAGNTKAETMEISLPPGYLARLRRHPALTGFTPARPAWHPLELVSFNGRSAQVSRGGLHLTYLEGRVPAEGRAVPLLRVRLEGDGALELGARLAETIPALPAFWSLEQEADVLAGFALPDAPSIAEETSLPHALAAALRGGLSLLLHHAPSCRPDASAHGVHQTRVATRRMRSIIRLMRGGLPDPGLPERFEQGLKELAAALGPARDWDVFTGGIGAQLAEAMPGEKRLRPLLRRAEATRREAYAALMPHLAGPSFRALIWQGVALIEALEALPRADDLHAFAVEVLTRRHKRLRRAGKDIEALPPDELHALRLLAKRLRYAAELLAPLWSGQAAKRYIRRLSRLQDALGLANDASVAAGLVRSLGARGWAGGAAEGFALARGAGSRDMALESWARWRKTKRFWPEAG